MVSPLRRLVAWLGDKLGDRLLGWVLGGGGVLLLGWLVGARKWIGRQWVCISSPSCTVPAWSVGLLVGALIVVVVSAAALVVAHMRARRHLQRVTAELASARATLAPAVVPAPAATQAFIPIPVVDPRLRLRWNLLRPVDRWADIQNVLTEAPVVIQDKIDGPFHNVEGCMERLSEVRTGYGHRTTFHDHCPRCGVLLFRVQRDRDGIPVFPDVHRVRAQALAELQRLHRNHVPITDGHQVELQTPQYWATMVPVVG